MPISGQFIQLLSALSEIGARREQLALSGRQTDLMENQFKKQVSEAHDKDIADALNTLVKLQPQAQEAFLTLGHKFNPEEMSMLRATASGLPPDMPAMAARAAQSGYGAMSPQEQGQVNREAATRNVAGMNVGGVAQSGLQEAVAQTIGQNPQMLQGMAQMQATQQTPFQAAGQQQLMMMPGAARRAAEYATNLAVSPYQQGQLDIGRGGVQAQFAGVNVQAMNAAADAANQALAAGAKGGLTQEQVLKTIIEDIPAAVAKINDPRTDKGAAAVYLRQINAAAWMIGRPDLALPSPNDPDAPAKLNALRRVFQGSFGGQGVPAQTPPPAAQPPIQAPPGSTLPSFLGGPQAAPAPGMPLPNQLPPFATQTPFNWYPGPRP